MKARGGIDFTPNLICRSVTYTRFFRLQGEKDFVIPEPYLGLIVGSLLTLIVSVISIFLTNHYSEKQWVNQKKRKELDKTMEQVYSPLYFVLHDTGYQMGYIGGRLKAYLERGISNKIVQIEMTNWLQDYAKDDRPSFFLRRILNATLGLIKPYGFQRDLFSLFVSLRSFEACLSRVSENTFAVEKTSSLERKFQSYVKLTGYYFVVLARFTLFTQDLISKGGEQIFDSNYEMILNTAAQEKIRELLKEPLDEEIEKFADEIIANAIKELSNSCQNGTKVNESSSLVDGKG